MIIMKIKIFGSGGNRTIPWPTCDCRVCKIAHKRGGKEVRYGNSSFIDDEKILIDAPEHIFYLLNKNKINQVKHIFISHWHPDHSAGLRVLQTAWKNIGPSTKIDKIVVYMTQVTYDYIVQRVMPALPRYLKVVNAKLKILEENKPFKIGSLKVSVFGAPEKGSGKNDVSYFLFEKDGKKVLIAPDETKYMNLSRIPPLDLLIKECGFFFKDPNGKRLVTKKMLENEGWDIEITFNETVEQIRTLKPKKTILVEIEELFGRTVDDYKKLEKKYKNLNIKFGYDGMNIKI